MESENNDPNTSLKINQEPQNSHGIESFPMDFPLGKQIELAGWVQGAFLDLQNILSLPNYENIYYYSKEAKEQILQKNMICIIISQSCDLVHSGAQEPVVEVLLLCQADNANPELQNLKNPRRIQIKHEEIIFESAAHWRITLPRTLLLQLRPVSILDSVQLKTLRRWLSRRYKRAAFAGEFERRWKQKKFKDKIKSILKKINNKVEMILVIGNADKELDINEIYKISLIAVVYHAEDEDHILENLEPMDGIAQKTLHQIVKDLQDILNGCIGIEVQDFDIQTPEGVSYQTVKNSLIWDADAISDQVGGLDISDEDDV
jgi:hypothetical protein